MDGMLYKALKNQWFPKRCKILYYIYISLMLDCTLYHVMYVGRQGFGLVNLEIRMIEGWIIKVLLYIKLCDTFYENGKTFF